VQSWIIKFLNFQIFGAARVGMTNVHRHTNFIKIGQIVAEISHLTIFKMAAVRHFGFLKVDFLNSWEALEE